MDRPIHILLVEDNAGDVRLLRRAMRGFPVPHEMHAVEHGEDALSFLNQDGEFAGAPDVNIILLDWNLPRLHGRDVLATLKADARLKTIPVVVLTSSEDPYDIHEAYKLYANCYVTKPFELHDYLSTVEQLERFWLSCARLPMVES